MPAIIGALRQVRMHFGDAAPSSINQAALRDYIAKRPWYGKDPETPRPVAKSTIDKEIRFLKQVLRFGAREGWGVEMPELKSTGQNPPRERFLTEDEYGRIYDNSAPHLRLFLTIALHTGMRKSAVLDMEWSQVDFERRIIWRRGGNRLKRRISVAMSDALHEVLRGAQRSATIDHVIEYRGKRIADIRKALTEACRRAKVQDVRVHDLRRTAASWMLQEGATFAQVAAILGDSEEVVRKHYAQFSSSFMRDAVNLIGRRA